MQLLSGCGRALRSGSSRGCSIQLQRSKSDNHVSKALVNIIFDAYWAKVSAAPRATKPDGFFTFCIAIVSEAQSKAT